MTAEAAGKMHGVTDQLLTTAELSLRADFPLGLAKVSPSARRVEGPGGSGAVEPRVMQILVVLAEADGKVVTRDTLFRRCWGGIYVGEDSLNRAIAGARRIAETAAAGSFAIETIPRTGYRLKSNAASTAARAIPVPANEAGVASALEAGINAWRLGLPAVPSDALARLRAAADLAPHRADVWGLLALLLRDAAEYAEPTECAALVGECEGAARRALALDPTEDNARTALAGLPPLFGGWLAARERLLAGRSAGRSSPASAHALAVLEMATGRPSAAIPIIEHLIEDDPLAAIFAYKRVYHLWTLGQLGEMDRVADRAMQLWPAHPAIWFARWWSLACTERPEAALLQLDEVAARPNIPPAALEVLKTTAVALAGPAQREQAVQINLKAAALGPAQSIAAVIHLCALGAIDQAFDVAHAYLLRLGPLVVPVRHTATDPSVTDQHRRVTQMLFIPPASALRGDPRFPVLCEAMGLGDYWRQTGLAPDFLASDQLR